MIKKTLLLILCFSGLYAAAQTVTTFAGIAGTGATTASTDSLPDAKFNEPYGIAIDAGGRIFIAEQFAHRVRMYNPKDNKVYTRAGSIADPNTGLTANYINGTGINARFNSPVGIAIDANGNIFVADQLNHCIRKISKFLSEGSGQIVTTYAGEDANANSIGGYANGAGTAARFDTPMDIAIAASGEMYVADAFNSCIRKIDAGGTVSLLAGKPGIFGFADGAGANAEFDLPVGVELKDNTTLIVADAGNRRIRSIDLTTGMVTTIAGDGNNGGDDGVALSSTFSSPNGLAVDGLGNIFIADGRNGQANTIRRISNGQVSTIAGTFNTVDTTNGQDVNARFNFPGQIAFNATNDAMYVTDVRNHTIRHINLKPVADFSTFNPNINLNVELTLNNTSLNNPTNYTWEITPATGYTYTGGTSASSTNPKITFTQTGSYTVKLTVANIYGNDVITKINYINVSSNGGGNAPIADFEALKAVISTSDTLFLIDKSTNNPNQWDWIITPSTAQFIDGTTASSQNPKLKFTQNGIYAVSLKVTNPLGNNVKTKANYIYIVPVGIEPLPLEAAVTVYPNPTTGNLTIDLGDTKVGNTLTVAVFNATGKTVYEQILFNNPGKMDIDLSNQAKGIYFVTVYDGKNKVNKTVVVQ